MWRDRKRAMTRFVLLCLSLLIFVSGICLGQQNPTGGGPEKHGSHSDHPSSMKSGENNQDPAVTRQSLPDDTNIINVEYRCAEKTSPGSKPITCTLAVSKSDFDALVHALDPNMPTSNRLSLASEYARLLIMGAEAENRGIDKSKDFKALAKFSTLQMLSTQLVRNINGDARLKASSAEAEQHFTAHAKDYQEITFDRIVVPLQSGGIRHQTEPASDRANKLRNRLLKGEPFATLQSEVTGLPIKDAAAAGRIGPIRCLSLQESLRKVCDLRPEETSAVIEDGNSLVIAKMVSRRALPVEEVRDEIRSTLERQRLQNELDRVRNPISMQLDQRYFGNLPAQDVAHKHGMQFPSATATDPSAASQSPAEPHKH